MRVALASKVEGGQGENTISTNGCCGNPASPPRYGLCGRGNFSCTFSVSWLQAEEADLDGLEAHIFAKCFGLFVFLFLETHLASSM